MDENFNLLTSEQVCERWDTKFGFHVKPSTLAVWRSQKKGPKFCKPMGQVRYPVKDIIEYEKEMIESGI